MARLEYLNYQAALGWYLRAVHFWGSDAMVLAMTLSMQTLRPENQIPARTATTPAAPGR